MTVASAAASRNRAIKLTLAAQDQTVLEWLSGVASDIRLVGGAVYARLRGDIEAPAQWLGAVADLDGLGDVLSTAPFPGLYTSGSTLFFKLGGREVSVELLPKEAFDAKLADLARGRVAFDHDSLAYDPATGTLNDPLRSKSTRGLRVTHGPQQIAQAFARVLDGQIELHQLGLVRTEAYQRFRHRVLAANGTKSEVAEAVCATLLARLATWTGVAPLQEIETLLESRLVSTSLRTALGIDVSAAIETAKAALAGDDAPNPAAWIAALLGSSLDGPASGWLLTGDRFDQLRSVAALAALH